MELRRQPGAPQRRRRRRRAHRRQVELQLLYIYHVNLYNVNFIHMICAHRRQVELSLRHERIAVADARRPYIYNYAVYIQ